MGQFRQPEPASQGFLLPPSPRDWLPQGHLAWFIMDTVEQLDIEELLGKYRICGKGELAYPPRVMLSLLIYGYATGVFSSRKIASAIDENLAFRVIASSLRPGHRSICRFREENLDLFKSYFVQVVQIAKEAKLVKMGTIAIDGTKVKANASKHKAMSYDRMQQEEQRLRREIDALTDKAKGQDEREDVDLGPDFRGDELPKELERREARLKTIQDAKKRLEERKAREAKEKAESEAPAAAPTPSKPASATVRQQEEPKSEEPKAVAPEAQPKPKDQENFTDPDSRIMKTGGGFEQCYNGQAAVDAKSQIIVGARLTQKASDNGQLVPVLNEAYENTGVAPNNVLADAGYKNEADLATLDAMKIAAFIAVGREGKDKPAPQNEQPLTAAMRKKLKTKRGRERYRKRKHIVEPVFGWLKRVLGFRAFSVRGLRKVAGEWDLVCMALNLRRMATMIGGA
jgi:transposase